MLGRQVGSHWIPLRLHTAVLYKSAMGLVNLGQTKGKIRVLALHHPGSWFFKHFTVKSDNYVTIGACGQALSSDVCAGSKHPMRI